jgi:hypothetical protein
MIDKIIKDSLSLALFSNLPSIPLLLPLDLTLGQEIIGERDNNRNNKISIVNGTWIDWLIDRSIAFSIARYCY